MSIPSIDPIHPRLLVDLNRSRTHRSLISELTAGLPESDRAEIHRNYYDPYRNQVQAAVECHIASGIIALQLSVHSFVPEHAGRSRNADMGLFYDPSRETEARFCQRHPVQGGDTWQELQRTVIVLSAGSPRRACMRERAHPSCRSACL